MVDWNSPQEIAKDAGVFMKFMHALLGLYIWEWAISLDFDWMFLSGKRKFRWPLVFYFANRYLLLGAMVGIAVALDSFIEVDCQSLYIFNQLSGQAAVGLASINLSLRTIAVWGNNRYIIGFLTVIILGHWSLILQGALLTAVWDPTANTCVIVKTNNTLLAATFIYSMVFDLIVLALNVWKLALTSPGAGASMRKGSSLAQLIFHDGIIYFFIAFLGNLIATIFMIMNLNPIMNVIFNVPSAIASTIVATRVVRRLSNFAHPDVYTHAASAQRSQTRAGTRTNKSGVQVQMETFTREDPDPVASFHPVEYGDNGYGDNKSQYTDNESKRNILPL
jgi:hypothetical protein